MITCKVFHLCRVNVDFTSKFSKHQLCAKILKNSHLTEWSVCKFKKKLKIEGKCYLFVLICAKDASNECLAFVYALQFVNWTRWFGKFLKWKAAKSWRLKQRKWREPTPRIFTCNLLPLSWRTQPFPQKIAHAKFQFSFQSEYLVDPSVNICLTGSLIRLFVS